jgi:prepilin-type N-terminal cleavage/methylation domain-containing protein
MKKKFKKGFTLVEMLVVVAIIGVLSTILYASYNKYISSTKVTVAKSEVLTIVQCFEAAMVDNTKNHLEDDLITYDTFTNYDDLSNLDLVETYNAISEYMLPDYILLEFVSDGVLKYTNTLDGVEIEYNYMNRQFGACIVY